MLCHRLPAIEKDPAAIGWQPELTSDEILTERDRRSRAGCGDLARVSASPVAAAPERDRPSRIDFAPGWKSIARRSMPKPMVTPWSGSCVRERRSDVVGVPPAPSASNVPPPRSPAPTDWSAESACAAPRVVDLGGGAVVVVKKFGLGVINSFPELDACPRVPRERSNDRSGSSGSGAPNGDQLDPG